MKKMFFVFLFFVGILNISAADIEIRYLSTSGSDSITIVNNNDKFQITSVRDGKIEIKDFDIYKTFLQSGNEEEYPRYIIKLDDEYIFSDYKNHLGENYLISSRILNIVTSNITTDINTCDKLLGYKFVNLLKNNIFKVIYISIPIMLIIYSTYDFAILAFKDSKEGVNGALKKFGKRVIAAVMIFLIPNILIFLTTVLSSSEVDSCIRTFKTTENIDENN